MSSFVYVISNGTHCKIGFTSDLKIRLKNLQTSSPAPLSIVATRLGGQDMENQIHSMFAERRMGGEWFTLNDQDIAKIVSLGFTRFEEVSEVSRNRRVRGKTPGDIALSKRIQSFLRGKQPTNTAKYVAKATGIKQCTIEKWFADNRCPSSEHLVALIEVFGPRIIGLFALEEPPEWVNAACRDDDLEAEITQIGALEAKLGALKAQIGSQQLAQSRGAL